MFKTNKEKQYDRSEKMKIRSGFVSNSSTSSFLIITTKEKVDKLLFGSDDTTRKLVESIIKNIKAFGQELVLLHWSEGNRNTLDYDWENIKFDEEYEFDELIDKFNDFVNRIGKGEDVIRHTDES
jgi:hypothetical protein